MERKGAILKTPEDLRTIAGIFGGFDLAEKLEAWGQLALRDPASTALLIGKPKLVCDVPFAGYED